ncbi:PQQ-binding-like beta-propeller repeat protein [Streptomyces sp. bgisy022]|uniref:outer membrane protein assembly factor BamB family protein n=1 Tax=Streptomyces sp. bgisy022 TaxID=3413769 RepID=UPI003D758DC7
MRELGGHRLLHRIGSGPLGHTYLGAGPDGQQRAVKEVHTSWGPPSEAGRRIETVLRCLDWMRDTGPDSPVARHTAHVVGGYDPVADRAWTAAPWLGDGTHAGGSTPAVCLADVRHPLPAGAILHLMYQLASLARQLHSQGLSLSGLKPTNLFLTARGPVVVDVHLALALRELLHHRSPADPAPHRPFLWADPAWLPPELRRFGTRTRTAGSIHAVGAIAVFACTRTPLRPATDAVDALTHHKHTRRWTDEALARWAANHGNVGLKLKKTALRSVRHRPWTRPGPRRLERIIASPLWGNHHRTEYRTAWEEEMRRLLRAGPGHGVPVAPPPPRVIPAPGPSTAPPGGRRAPVVSAASTVPGRTARDRTASRPTGATAGSRGPATARDTSPPGRPPSPAAPDPAVTAVDRTPAPARPVTGASGRVPPPTWTVETNGPLLAPPLPLGSLLLLTCGNEAHAVDTTTGSREFGIPLPGTAESAPVRWDGRMWWALREGALSGHNLNDPHHRVRLELDGDPGSHSPVVLDDRLWTGTTGGLFEFRPLASSEAVGRLLPQVEEPVVSPLATDGVRLWVPTERGGLIAVDPSTGVVHGPHPPWDAAGCATALLTDGAYIGDATGTVRRLNTAAVTRGRWTVSALPVSAPPVPHEGLLLVTDHGGTVTALALDDGAVRWRAATDGDGQRPVAVLGAVVYVCGARAVRRLDAATGRELEPLTQDGPTPTSVTVTRDHLHVGFADGRLSTWRRHG